MRTRIALTCLLLAAPPLHAAPDTVDAAFAASAGQVFLPNHYGGVASVLVQPDGKILFGSNEMPGTVNGNPLQMPLIRFNPDGTVDNTFYADNEQTGSDGGIYYDGQGWSEVHALGLLSDGKIVAAGVMQGVRTGTRSNPGTIHQSNSIVRFNADGTIDTTFQTVGTIPWPTGGLNYIEDVTIQPDDKIIAVGGFGGFRDSFAVPPATGYGIARLNVNGTVDTGFQIDPAEFGVPAGVLSLRGQFRQAALDSAGRVLVAGYFEWGPAFPVAGVVNVFARLNPDGSRDTSFAPVIPASVTEFENVVVEPSGKIVVIGALAQSAGTSWMVRFNPDGTQDASFVLDPSVGPVRGRPLQVDAAGRYLVNTRSTATTFQDKLVRLLPNGALDPAFTALSNYVNGPAGAGPGYFGTFTTAPSGKVYSGSFFDRVNGVNTVKLVAFEGDSAANGPGQLQFSFAGFTGTEAGGVLRVGVTRFGGVTGAASATLSLNHITTSAADLGAFTTSVNFAAGTGGTQYISIPITADAAQESTETATLSLTGITGATAGSLTAATLTVLDSNSPPQIVREPQTLFVPPGSPFSLTVGAVSGTLPLTYQWYKGGDLIPGATKSTYTVAAADLALHQGNYTVVVTNSVGSTTSAVATVTVKNPAILGFAAATATAVENDGTLSLTLQRSGSDVGAVSVQVTLVPGSAVSPGDFTASTTTVSWANGDTASKTVSIPLTNDAAAESPESFTAVLGTLSLDAIFGGITTVNVTVLDDDAGPVITQPLLPRRAVTGWNSTLSISVQSQTAVTYEWFKNGVLIPGAITSTLSFTPVTLADYGLYSVSVTNTAGTVTSGPVELGARPNPLTPVTLDLTISSNQFSGVRVRPNGGYLIFGAFTSVPTSTGNVAAQRFLRTGADGKVDTTFLPPFGSTVNHALELPDGSILAAGSFTTFGVISVPGGFVKVLPNGTADADFLAALPSSIGTIRDLKLGADGWIYVVHSTGVDRMNAAGVVDPAFRVNVSAAFDTNPTFNFLEFGPGGTFYLAGNFNLLGAPSGQTLRRLVRLNPNGTYDPTWKYTTAGALSYFGVQSDGRIIVSASSGTLVRLLPDGSSDPTFTTITSVYNNTFAVAADDSIYIASGTSANAKLRHFLPNGALDTIFNNGTDPGAGNTIQSIVALSNGLISLNGSFTTFNGQTSSSRPLLLTGELRTITISSQPAAQVVNPGTSPVFSVVASSVLPLTYQWRKNGVNLSGETNPTLTLASVTAASSGDYSVVISSTAGSITSAAAKLTVRDAPAVLTWPAGGTYLTGSGISLTVDFVALEPATFEWFRNGVLVSGQITNVLNIPAPTAADSGAYTLRITNGLGIVTSPPILVNVVPSPASLVSGFLVPTGGTPNFGIVIPEPAGGAYLYSNSLSGVTHPSGTYASYFERVDANGNIAEPFTSTANNQVQRVVRDPSGNLILTGFNFFMDAVSNRRVARIGADGTTDVAFSTAANTVATNLNLSPLGVAFDADGRILLCGGSTLIRLNTDGSLHTNLSSGLNGLTNLQAVKVLPDGKILVLGNASMRRLLADGTADSTFTFPTLSASPTFTEFEVTLSGEILLPYANFTGQAIYRLAANGALLQTIDFAYATYNLITRFHALPDGSMLVAHSTGKRLTRLKPDGTVDPLFDVGTGFNNNISSLATAADGSTWVAGNFTQYNGANARGLVRLQGTPVDVLFTAQPAALTTDTGSTAQFTVAATAPGGASLSYLWRRNGLPLSNGGDISGATSATLSIANAEDADEASYDVIVTNGTTGRVYTSAPAALTVLREPEFLTLTGDQNLEVGQALTLSVTARGAGTLGYRWLRNGEPIIGANAATYTVGNSIEANTGIYTVEITNAYGTFTSSPVVVNVTLPAGGIRFGTNSITFTSGVNAILPLPDGRTLVGGAFTTVIANAVINNIDELALLDASGNLVTTFDLNPSGAVNALVLMPDGGVLVGGNFTQIGGTARDRLARLTPSLAVDAAWTPVSGFAGSVLSIEPAGGGYYIGGLFTAVNGDATRAYVCRIQNNGALDPFFTPPALGGGVYRIRRSGDGIVIGGNFTLNNPVASINQTGIVRLHSTGAHDTAFVSSMNFGVTVNDLIALPDGKWLAGGNSGSLRRFNANGSTDNTWLTTVSADVSAIALQRDGRILVGGNFTTIAGQSVNRLARLNANGTFDTTFAQGAGADGSVTAVALDALGAIHIGGAFNNYRGTARGRYALLNGTPLSLGIANQPAGQTVNPGAAATFSVSVSATDTVSYQWRRNGAPLSDGGDISGATTATLTIANAEDADEGDYTVLITHNGDATTVLSDAAVLTVLGAPEILTHPAAVTTETGLGATFRVAVRGVAPLTYEWFRGTTLLTNGPGIAGADTHTLVLSNLAVADSGSIKVRITNSLNFAESTPAALVVQKLPHARDRSVILPVSLGGNVNDFLVFADGSYLLGGTFTTIGHTAGSATRRYLAKLNANGALDTAVPQINGSGVVEAMALASDGKIYIGGGFTSINTGAGGNIGRIRIARLNANLTLDTTFNPPGTGPLNTVKTILPLADGKVLIGGDFNSVNSVAGTAYLARLNSDGTVDTTFVSQGTTGVRDIAPAAAGNFWVSHPNSYGGQQRIVLVDANGTRVPEFVYAGTMTSDRVLPQSDGTVLSLSGNFPYIQRIQPTGALVSGWPNTGGITPGNSITAGLTYTDGRTILGGNFTTYASITRNRLAAIEADGSLIAAFDPGAGLNGTTSRIRLDAAGRLWLAGSFTTYRGDTVPGLVVLNGLEPVVTDPFLTFVASLPEGQRGEGDDPDLDHVPNLIEFVFGTSPSTFTAAPALVLNGTATGASLSPSLNPAKNYRIVEIETPKSTQGVTLNLAATADLTFADGATATEFGTRTDNGTTETRRYYLTPAVEDAPRLFWRLEASR